jgi:hypothetical protein
MKKLLLLLLLSFLSSNSLAKVGDVYYCEPYLDFDIGKGLGYVDGEYVSIGRASERELENFSFLRNAKTIKFSESFDWVDSMPYKLVLGNSSYEQSTKEEFQGYDDFTNQQSGGSGGVINFVYTQTGEEGQFSFTLQFSDVVWVIIAECEIL